MKHNFSSSIEDSLKGRSSADSSQNKESLSNTSNTNSTDTGSSSLRKHAGGRPTNKSKGKKSRKQYTLTLLPEMYAETLAAANHEGLSFSMYVERAIKEYRKKEDSQ